MKSKHRKKRKPFQLPSTTTEKKPEGVREELWRDWKNECRKFVSRNSSIEKRNELISYGFFFILEGKKYEIAENYFPGFLHFREISSLRKRSIPFSAKNGIPKVDIISLQTLLDKLLVSEVMAI